MAMDWGVESLRLSLFSPDALSISDADWMAITGEKEAETRQLLPGGKRYIGKFAGGQFTFIAVGQRIDLILSYLSVGQPETQNLKLPIIGPWNKVRETFVQSTSKWLDASSFPTMRMAFATVLLCQTKDRRESYQALKSLLKSIKVDPDGMHDLLFRINWRAQSAAVNGLTLNRLTNWGALQFSHLVLQLTGADVTTSTSVPDLSAIRLEIDHSTDQEHKKPFDHKDLIPIYKELVAMACENATKGERP